MRKSLIGFSALQFLFAALYCITIVGLLVGIPMIIFGIQMLRAARDKEYFSEFRSEYTNIAIFNLIFTIVLGILMFLMYNKIYEKNFGGENG